MSLAGAARLLRDRRIGRCCSRLIDITSCELATPVLARGYATGGKEIKLGFVGAGGINFGTLEGTWNHAERLNKFPDVSFSAIIEPNTALAEQRLKENQEGPHGQKWANCQLFKSHRDMLKAQDKPDCLIIGLPPEFHGSVNDPAANIELECAEAGLHMFVEKPLSAKPPEEVMELSRRLEQLQAEKGIIVAVGYMLRYSPAVEAARRLLAENKTPTAALVGRYVATYNHIRKRSWWDGTMSGGTIVEQATHFVDMMRYLGGEIERSSIQAIAVGPDYPLAEMPQHPEGENLVPWEDRVNRVTCATWRFEGGAVGALTHTVVQHEQNFFTTFEVVADGLHILIGDPYNTPTVRVRRALSNEYEDVPLDLDKDMYVHQFEGFLKAVRTGDTSDLRCPYQTAAKTYQASKWITQVANANRKPGAWAAGTSSGSKEVKPSSGSKDVKAPIEHAEVPQTS